MKVIELLESEFDNAPIKPDTHLRDLRKKRNSLSHRREVVMDRLKQIFPDYDGNTLGRMFNPWLIKSQTIDSFPEQSRTLVAALKRLYIEGENLQKQEVAANSNMRYARHDTDLALRHAKVRGSAYPEGEDAIAQHPQAAYEYATSVIHHRFPKGEQIIKTDPELWVKYKNMFGIQ